jgi:hypothetical protein
MPAHHRSSTATAFRRAIVLPAVGSICHSAMLQHCRASASFAAPQHRRSPTKSSCHHPANHWSSAHLHGASSLGPIPPIRRVDASDRVRMRLSPAVSPADQEETSHPPFLPKPAIRTSFIPAQQRSEQHHYHLLLPHRTKMQLPLAGEPRLGRRAAAPNASACTRATVTRATIAPSLDGRGLPSPDQA